jgi:hypothetical protein
MVPLLACPARWSGLSPPQAGVAVLHYPLMLSASRDNGPMTDIPPPPPETPAILILLVALAGALFTAVGYVVQRVVWPGHDPVELLISFFR